MNGKIKYSGTEKIEKKVYDELEEKFEARLNAMADEIRRSVLAEIRDELQPETVPYDRLRLIEQRIHEMSITQDGIVREIVDIKTTSNSLSAADKKPTYETAALTNQSAQIIYDILASEQPVPAERSRQMQAEPDYSDYMQSTQSMPQEPRRVVPPPGFNQPPGPATPITPVSFNSRRADGWEYQEFVPVKKNNAEPEKFVPAKTIPARDDPFYFADSQEEVLDVSSLREPEPPRQSSFEQSSFKQSAFEDIPLTIQKIKTEEPEVPDRAEYIIGNNSKQVRSEREEDTNANCEYIIAEKDVGSRKFGGRRGSKPASELKEKVISSDEDDTEIITYE
ncbi:hypothetical protein [Methanimicrococcus blatticola]|uniref:hypothetical protein n=1 Tax=Methanimicrococcus blatticola TaxID=91560 RepID=UPI001CBE0007|nr:hypothetical protein [Methanimicrococcus blatticola]